MAAFQRRSLFFVVVTFFLLTVSRAPAAGPAGHVGLPVDWSHSHLIFTNAASPQARADMQNEPRVMANWLARTRAMAQAAAAQTSGRSLKAKKGQKKVQVDWGISLGAGAGANGTGVAPTMSPAKYSFDINATPDCTNDFVVFPVNIGGVTGGQANLVGINNLYSGPSGTPLCALTTATVTWAYNVTTVTGGVVRTSPGLSLDGTKVAFVESGTSASVYHVLTWTAGQGTVTVAAAPTMTSLQYATAGNTRSSPWIDYSTTGGCPCAYVGANDGNIYKILDAFGSPTLAGAPYPITVVASAVLTSPVLVSGHLIVGASDGNLYAYNATTGALVGTVLVGGGTTPTVPVFDPPIVDATNPNVLEVFATASRNNTTAAAALVQARLDVTVPSFASVAVAGIGGNGSSINTHAPAFDSRYFANPTTGYIYACGIQAASTQPTLYRFNFTGSPPAMGTTPDGSSHRIINATGIECSPLTAFANPNIATTDILYVSQTSAFTGNVYAYDITGAMPIGPMTGWGGATTARPGGTSAIIVDNVSTAGHASSIYFGTLANSSVTATCGGVTGVKCAVKLTQQDAQ